MDGDSVFEPFAERGILDSMRVLKDSRKRRKEESDSLLLHFDGREDFVLRVVSDELIGERAWINQNTDKAHMHPLRVDEKTITGLLCEYC